MSLDVRYLVNENQNRDIFRIRNQGVTPMIIDFYDDLISVPLEIRDYAYYARKYPQTVSYELAKLYGAEKYLYPERTDENE